MTIDNLDVRSRDELPSLAELERSLKSLDGNSRFYDLADASMEQIKLFERNKVTGKTEDEFVVSIDTALEPGQITLTKLGSVARGIQRVYTSMFNDVFGKGNAKGLIPRYIVDSSQLILENTSPGSFNLHLGAVDDYFVDGVISEEGLGKLKEFFQRLPEDDPSFIIEEIGYRTFAVSKNWFKEMDKEDISLSIINKGSKTKIDKEKIHYISNRFDEIKSKIETESIFVTGVIDSANRSVSSIKIISDSGIAISAKTNREIFTQGLVIATKMYQFNLTKSTITNKNTGNKKETFILNDLESTE
ncbi:hypothetical protein [Indiicoccus explosivorum]|uniref:hypothetical protein n=1 Tax=Indiicoccus explosivorum TaxID=1917864 RepID=UPI000B439129|nr:hypothetical protein [Indiicoccus explosivorum]